MDSVEIAEAEDAASTGVEAEEAWMEVPVFHKYKHKYRSDTNTNTNIDGGANDMTLSHSS